MPCPAGFDPYADEQMDAILASVSKTKKLPSVVEQIGKKALAKDGRRLQNDVRTSYKKGLDASLVDVHPVVVAKGAAKRANAGTMLFCHVMTYIPG